MTENELFIKQKATLIRKNSLKSFITKALSEKSIESEVEEDYIYSSYYIYNFSYLFRLKIVLVEGVNGIVTIPDSCTLSKKQQADYEASELWAEDEKISERIQSQIEKAARTKQWGSIGELLIEKILAKKNIRMDYKRILAKFRTSVMSSQRSLTRLRPNRRYGYEYMGSRYKDTVKLLIAVDSSGSISQEDLENFFSIINHFFKYGAKEIKVIVFDTQITQEMDFKKARESLKIKGRGGTDFQAAIDYYEQSD